MIIFTKALLVLWGCNPSDGRQGSGGICDVPRGLLPVGAHPGIHEDNVESNSVIVTFDGTRVERQNDAFSKPFLQTMPYTLEEFNMYSAAQAAVGSRSEHQGAVVP